MLARHDLVWLCDDGWRHVRRTAPDSLAQQAMDQWRGADWPATVRRQDTGCSPGEVCLGITLPRDSAAGARTRVSLRCLQAHIRRAIRPLRLDAADAAIFPQWARAWQAWRSVVEEAGLDVRVYGSLAMEVLTGRPYLTDRSDIDLLFFPASPEQLRAGAALFAGCPDGLPLDGEIIFPSGRAVAWKEWCQTALQDSRSRVLVKQIDGVRLCSVAELQAELGEAACVS